MPSSRNSCNAALRNETSLVFLLNLAASDVREAARVGSRDGQARSDD